MSKEIILFIIVFMLALIVWETLPYLQEQITLKTGVQETCSIIETEHMQNHLDTYKLTCTEADYRCFKYADNINCVTIAK